MNIPLKTTLVFALSWLLAFPPVYAGRGGGRGGGGARGGGGMRAGGGGMQRGGGGMRGGGMQRAGGGMQRGGGGMQRGGSGMQRGGGGMQRPSTGGRTPSMSSPRPGGGGGAGRPSMGGGQRPGGGAGRPSIGAGNRPGGGGPGRPGGEGIGNRPGQGAGGARPGVRPGGDNASLGPNRPGVRPDNRPGGGDNPFRPGGGGARPGVRPGGDNASLGPNRPGVRPDNRPDIRPDNRPGGGGNNNWVNNRPGFGNNNDFNNINVNRPNFNNVNNGIINRPGWNNRYPGNGGWGTWGRPGNFPAWSYRPGWNYHQGWVHGYWAGQNNNWWNNWGGFATGLALGGLGAWGIGSSLYNWGYASYANPYYVTQPVVVQQPVVVDQPVVVQQTPVYDYSQPIDTSAPPPEEATADPALTAFDQAREAFKAGEFTQALAGADAALKTLPNDAAIHEFRALTLFALGQYDQAAATLYAVLSVGPGFDWTTLIGLYSSVDVYTQQLRALEAYVKEHPDSAAGHFVLGYHYFTQGHAPEALREFQAVTKVQPNDTLAAQMVRQLQAATGETTAEAEPPPAAEPAAPPPTEAQLAGTWKASPTAGVTITLTLAADKKFSWVINQAGKDQKIEGTYVLDNGDLILTPPTGAPLSGQVAMADAGKFTFNAKGGGPNDPGLTFTK
jgi:tetratricopeptide (TPR) repeat protein